ncbi:MAG: sodium:proton antiporter, partial [Candidatus Aminicenantia bacterium]
IYMVRKFFYALIFVVILLIPSELQASEKEELLPVSIYWSIPFIALLFSISFIPLINRKWWDRYYPIVSILLSLIVAFQYIFFNPNRLLHSMLEYFSFISLIGSLFVVSGGILIKTTRRGTPFVNVAILFTGAVISNIFGTTGASMLLIRPYIRLNRYRFKTYHLVFFIFVVSNIGGCLTPIGDPPLFLGYLKGIPFFWFIKNLIPLWSFEIFLVLGVFFLIDYISYQKIKEEEHLKTYPHIEIKGLKNLVFIFIILSAVFIKTPFREIIMILSAIASYIFTEKRVHEENEFNFHPIQEVAILFLGIFSTMTPALDWLELNAKVIGITSPIIFFWTTGIFSAFLDNAPTFLTFLSTAIGVTGLSVQELLINKPIYIKAISAASVFFGANTYIGNGPNFMVKSIAEHSKLKAPHFLEYIYNYSLPILVPTFILVSIIFF